MKLIVVHPQCLNSSALKGLRWIYADEKMDVKFSVERALTSNLELITAQEFQKFARSVRAELIDSVDSCIFSSNHDSWVLTSLHRNPFVNNIFLHLIWVAYLRTHQDDSDTIVVITESLGLLRTLNAMFSDGGNVLEIGILWFRYTFIKALIRSSIGGLFSVGRFMVRMLLSRIILSKKFLSHGVDAEVLLDTYLYDHDISENGTYHSPHMPDLTEWYVEQKIPVAIIATLYDVKISHLPNLYRRVKLSINHILPFERLVSWIDIFSVLSKVIYFIVSKRDVEVGDFARAYKKLITYSRYQAAVSNIQPLLFGVVPHRLDVLGYKPKLVLSWFENQARDRAFAISMKTFMGAAKHVAFRPYIPCEMHTNIFTTARQHVYGICPSETWVSGSGMVDMMRSTDKLAKYRIMPSLRYQHLWRFEAQEPIELKLLILLPHSIPESMNILECVFGCGPQILDFGSINIKSHRNIPVDILQRWANDRWAFSHKSNWVVDSLPNLLKDATIVITSGTSAALESVCYGKPVIIIGQRAGLSMNPMTFVDQQLWEEVYSSLALENIIRKWTPSHPLSFAARLKIGNEIRSKYFTPVNSALMEGFRP